MFYRMVCAASAAGLILSVLAKALIASAEPKQAAEPEYMTAIQQELLKLGIEATCRDAERTCVYKEKLENGGPSFDVVLRYSTMTDTIYIYIDRFIQLGDSKGPSLELARKLLDLNREMVTAKFEWDRSAEAIRLSVVLNTDSNFDRRAFRSQILGLRAVANRLWPELSKLAFAAAISAP